MNRRICWTLFMLLLAGILTGAETPPLADGLYLQVSEGAGRPIVTQDGFKTAVGEPVAWTLIEKYLCSVNNENSQFFFSVTIPFDKAFGDERYLLFCNGVAYRSGGWGSNGNETYSTQFHIAGLENAEAVGRLFEIEPRLRQHPGHKMCIRFSPVKDSFVPGEKVAVTLRITNVGDTPFAFLVGGRQRGPRDNQYGFTARWLGGSGLPDTGDSVNFGGICTNKTLQPGEAFEDTVDLGDWFSFTKSGYYECRGSYFMRMLKPIVGEEFHITEVWDDCAAGEFAVRIKDAEKGTAGEENRPLLKEYKGNSTIPDALYQTYARFVMAATSGDVNDVRRLLLRCVKCSYEERPEATRSIGEDLNFNYLKNGFRGEITHMAEQPDDGFFICTPTSILNFIQTASGRWKICSYQDISPGE